uniref:Arginine/serine-rich coiled-coil 1 n=1 Tax=Stegastes partitus TaxID=144197 RepID=A0A3B4Z832_9TELE
MGRMWADGGLEAEAGSRAVGRWCRERKSGEGSRGGGGRVERRGGYSGDKSLESRLLEMQGDKRVKKPVIALKIRLQSITLDFTRPASNKRAVIYELRTADTACVCVHVCLFLDTCVHMCMPLFTASFCVTCVSEGTSLEEQVRRIKDIEAIESDSFVPQAFKSSRDDIKVRSVSLFLPAPQSLQPYPQDVTLPVSIIYNDSDTLAHPNLFMDKEKAEELWLNRLVSLRQERLMGSPVT